MFTKKLAIFYILDILKEYTDEEHSLTQKEIGDKLLSIYGIDLERKSIAANLESLMEDLDYDVNKNPGGGYYLGEREFDETEVRFLTDAIFSSKIINGAQAKELAQKISSSLSRYERKEYRYVYKSTEISRTSNKEFFHNIDVISYAIEHKKKIKFQYFTYDKKGELSLKYNGFEYVVSPYFLVNNFGKYYLICNYKYENHTNYRVDYITKIEAIDEDIKPFKEVPTLGADFDITKYINDHVYMFGSNVVNAKLEVINGFGIMPIKDWFGEHARIKEEDGKIIAYIKSDENALLYWLLQYQEYVLLLEPFDLRQRVINTLSQKINKYYNDKVDFDVDIDLLIKRYFKDDVSHRINNVTSNDLLRDDFVQFIRNNSPKSLQYYSKDNKDIIFEIKGEHYACDIVYASNIDEKSKFEEINNKYNELKTDTNYKNKYLLLLLHNEYLNKKMDDRLVRNQIRKEITDISYNAVPNTEIKNHSYYSIIKIN